MIIKSVKFHVDYVELILKVKELIKFKGELTNQNFKKYAFDLNQSLSFSFFFRFIIVYAINLLIIIIMSKTQL